MIVIIIVIIIIAIIAYYYYYYYYSMISSVVDNSNNTNNTKSNIINNRIQELYKIVNDICYRCDVKVNYLIKDDIITFVELGELGELGELDDEIINILHITVWNDAVQRPYNINSLLIVLLSQLVSITGESNLLSIASKLGYNNGDNGCIIKKEDIISISC